MAEQSSALLTENSTPQSLQNQTELKKVRCEKCGRVLFESPEDMFKPLIKCRVSRFADVKYVFSGKFTMRVLCVCGKVFVKKA